MQIILPTLQDPTDIVIQGAVIGDLPTAQFGVTRKWGDGFVLQGRIGFDIPELPVPPNIVGQHDWYSVPDQTGLKVYSGGEVKMVDIKPKPFVIPETDYTQSFLYSKIPMDSTGELMSLMNLIERYMVDNSFVLAGVNQNQLSVSNPRTEILNSGLAKFFTAPQTAPTFGTHLMDTPTESTQKWFITGVTKDSTGAALGSCQVVVMKSNKIIYNFDQYGNPICCVTTSDASGNYSVQVPNDGTYQVLAYKTGSPDVAGLTVNTVTASLG